jgi:hypothetical protein
MYISLEFIQANGSSKLCSTLILIVENVAEYSYTCRKTMTQGMFPKVIFYRIPLTERKLSEITSSVDRKTMHGKILLSTNALQNILPPSLELVGLNPICKIVSVPLILESVASVQSDGLFSQLFFNVLHMLTIQSLFKNSS